MIYKNNNTNNKYILLNIIELNKLVNQMIMYVQLRITTQKLTSFNVKQKLLTLLRLFIDELSKLCLLT